MKIIHRVSFNATEAGNQTQLLDELNIPYELSPLLGPNKFVTLDISEDHQHWEKIRDLIPKWNGLDVVRTQFSESELNSADFLVMRSSWVHGYPMPDDENGYLDVTYGRTGCDVCGNGRLQRAPFQMRSEPKWGRRHVMQLNWIVDEFFVTPYAYRSVFADFGIGEYEVLKHKKGTRLENVVQLQISAVAEDPLKIGEPDNVCPGCKQPRYKHQSVGYFPGLPESETRASIFRSQERFGEGAITWSEVIVSQEVYRAVAISRLVGFEFHPLSNQKG